MTLDAKNKSGEKIQLIIEVTVDDTVSIIRPDGKIDASSSAEFETTVMQLVETGQSNVIVDLGSVSFMVSAGLRVLLGAAKKLARNDRALRVFGLNGLVLETFEISGFVSIIDVRSDETAAREGLG